MRGFFFLGIVVSCGIGFFSGCKGVESISDVVDNSTATLHPLRSPTFEPTATATQQLLQPTFNFPFPVTTSSGSWLIKHPAREIQIEFDQSKWESTQFDEFIPLYYEGGPVLVHREIDGCHLSLNVGGGVPMDWVLETGEVFLGDHQFSKTTFLNDDQEIQFVIYDQLFRVTFGETLEHCIKEVESVLGSIRTE